MQYKTHKHCLLNSVIECAVHYRKKYFNDRTGQIPDLRELLFCFARSLGFTIWTPSGPGGGGRCKIEIQVLVSTVPFQVLQWDICPIHPRFMTEPRGQHKKAGVGGEIYVRTESCIKKLKALSNEDSLWPLKWEAFRILLWPSLAVDPDLFFCLSVFRMLFWNILSKCRTNTYFAQQTLHSERDWLVLNLCRCPSVSFVYLPL